MPDGRARQVRGSKEEGETAKIEAVKVKTAEINNVGAGVIVVTSTTVVWLVPFGALMAPIRSQGSRLLKLISFVDDGADCSIDNEIRDGVHTM